MKVLLCSLLVVLSAVIAFAQAPQFSHIVIVVQENRTPDNLFGSNPTFEPGVDIQTVFYDKSGTAIQATSIPLAGCYDISHGNAQFVTQYAGGAMTGFDGKANGTECNGASYPEVRYVQQSDVQIYFDMAMNYGWANYMFQTNEGPSFPAHQFLFSGTSAPTTYSDLFASGEPVKSQAGCNAPSDAYVELIDPTGKNSSTTFPCFEHPTLTDLLDAAGLTWRWYSNGPSNIWTTPDTINHICVSVAGKCTGADWANVSLKPTNVLTDISNCDLANLSWVNPAMKYSDHPEGNDGSGPSWVASIVNAIGTSACGYWDNTAILVTWDDWGGWFDHVPPPRIGQSNGWGANYVYGFRVPLLVVSAYTPSGLVDNGVHDFGSFLRFAENNWGLGLIGPGYYADSYADDLSAFFPLTSPQPFMQINTPTVDFVAKGLDDPDND